MNLIKTTFKILIISLFINSCNEATLNKDDSAPIVDNLELNDLIVYNSSSKYANILKECATTKLCTLNELPLIRETGDITKDSISSRLVVSHKWMGDRFIEMLDILEPDIKELLGAVTAIVIDDSIHPAFYTTQTGAVYIDPRYLWLSKDEASTITQKDDFRVDYGNSLKFIPAWRYIKNNQNAIKYYDLNNPVERSKEDIKLNLAKLLYHELAHANDFANKDLIASVNRDIPIVTALEGTKEQRVSTKLNNNYPLTQITLKHLGAVLYLGEDATNSDKELLPYDVGSLFASDIASNMYNYANQYEDLAMLFESALMKYHYNIDMDIGFVDNPDKPQGCNDYILGWGVRNRIAKDTLKPRVEFVLKNILPSSSWESFIQNGIGSTTNLPTNIGWCESIDSNSSKKAKVYSTIPIPKHDLLPPY